MKSYVLTKLKVAVLTSIIILVSGCASFNGIPFPSDAKLLDKTSLQWMDDNKRINLASYGNQSAREFQSLTDIDIAVAISGGGQRAASFGLGVLVELDKIQVDMGQSLLNEVDYFSTVSGGGWPVGAYLARRTQSLDNGVPYQLSTNETEEIKSRLRLLKMSLLDHCLIDKIDSSVTQINDGKSLKYSNIFVSNNQSPRLPYLFSNAASHSDLSSFVFTPEYHDKFQVSGYRYCGNSVPVQNFGDVPVSVAIGTSASFPGTRHTSVDLKLCDESNPSALPNNSYICTFGYDYLHLIDGGVYDNLGVRTLFEAMPTREHISRKLLIVSNASSDTPLSLTNDSKIGNYGSISRVLLDGGMSAAYSYYQRSLLATAESLSIKPVELSFELIGRQNAWGFSTQEIQALLLDLPTLSSIYSGLELNKKSTVFRELYNRGKFFKASYKTTSVDQDLLIELGRLAVRLEKNNILSYLSPNGQ